MKNLHCLKNILLGFFVLFVISCSKDNEEALIPEPPTPAYSLKNIEFIFGKESTDTIEVFPKTIVTVSNATSTTQNYKSDDIFKDLKETSEFKNFDIEVFSFLKDSTFVSVPLAFDPTKGAFISGKWLLASSDSREKGEYYLSSSVAPYCQLVMKCNIKFHKISATCVLTLLDENTYKEVKATGEWVGVYISGVDSRVEINPINK